MNEVSTLNPCNRPDRGMSADAGATALFILVIIGVIAAAVWSMWGKKDAGTELTNYQTLATNTIGMMKGVDGYAFMVATVPNHVAPFALMVKSWGTATVDGNGGRQSQRL